MLYETEWVNADARLGKYVLANDVENVFSRYETQFAKVVRRVEGKLLSVHGENEPICNDEEMHLLVRFIANLILRNPKTMELYQLSEIADEIRHDEDIMVICELLDRLGFGGGESVVKAAQKKGVLTEEFGDGETFELMKEIEVLPAHFFLAKQGNFITSDFPVSYGRDRTIKDGNQTAIFLPLTKRTAVLYGMYDGLMGNRMTEINNEIVEELNGIYQKGQITLSVAAKNRETEWSGIIPEE